MVVVPGAVCEAQGTAWDMGVLGSRRQQWGRDEVGDSTGREGASCGADADVGVAC